MKEHVFDRLKDMEIRAAKGENKFTMSRGSFNYKKVLKEKCQLKKIAYDDIPGGFRMEFMDPHYVLRLAVTVLKDETGLITVSFDDSGSNGGYNRFWLQFENPLGEQIYGCGETYSKFDLKGEVVRIFVAEHQNANRIGRKLIRQTIFGKAAAKPAAFSKYESYYAQPTYVSSKKYFMHADTDQYAEFNFFTPGLTELYFQGLPTLYFYEGKNFPKISEKLSSMLGRQRELPDWVYDGAILAVQQGPDVINEKIQKAQGAGARVCGIWSQDWCGCRRTGFGYQVMWNWEQDRELYPELEAHIKKWKEQGIRFRGYINPFMALEKDLYKEASAKGYCVKDKDGKDYLVTITTFPAAMIDFTNPEAYEWYKGVIKKNMIGIGMGGWMADFGEYLPMDCVLYNGESPELWHNRWPAIWAKLNREAVEECGVQDDVFFFTRAGHTGTIKESAMMWTGDQHVDWSEDDGMPSVIPATLSLAMSGYGLTHSDIGGYTTFQKMRRSKELLMRWEEMNAFSPLMRSHEGNQPVNNVQFADDAELLAQLARTTKMHAALKPYLKKCVAENAERGIPVMRPVFYHYDEPEAYKESTEYLLGRDILVAPVLKEGAVSRTVYLPKDNWVNIFTGQQYYGGTVEVKAPIGQPPVFVRKDSPGYKEILAIAEGIDK